jgi:3-methyladenine DNA glycosylase AlkD
MTKKLISLFTKNSNKKQSLAMSAYMRNIFSFCGIPSPLRKTIEKEWMKTLNITTWKQLKDIAQEVRNMPEREYQYTTITLLEKYKKLRIIDSIKFFEKLITTKSWRDTVDSIDTNLV